MKRQKKTYNNLYRKQSIEAPKKITWWKKITQLQNKKITFTENTALHQEKKLHG